MKKIIFILTAATLISCTKNEVAYEPTHEIGFTAVAGNITKAVVTGNVYPTKLNMYINSYVHATTVPTTPDYIRNGEFTQVGTYASYTGDNDASDIDKATYVWGGGSSASSRYPYYWPNKKTLHFSGYSKSGSYTSASYNPSEDALTIEGYKPGVGTDLGVNDLMWFPSTKNTRPDGYGKETKYVPVEMFHTCSWITFMVKGDISTGSETSTYKVTSLTMKGLDMTANVVCTGDASLSQNNLSTYVVWSENTTKSDTYSVSVNGSGVELKSTYNTYPKNLETGTTASNSGNIVVIPQTPGTIDIEWINKSSIGEDFTDSASGLSLSIGKETVQIDGVDTEVEKPWEPGKHYIYTITIKANEILIAPTPKPWGDPTNGNITVE